MNPISHTQGLKKSPKSFRRLTGLGVNEFDQLLEQLQPLYEYYNTKRLASRQRQRAAGAGGKFSLSLEDGLLMLLIYYRCYVTHIFLGFLFGIDDSNVGRNINPLAQLLAGIFRIPQKRLKIESEEVVELFFDGSEQPIQRLKRGQKRHYSGKKKAHTRKVQVVVSKRIDDQGKSPTKIEGISKSYAGSSHDKKIYDKARMWQPKQLPSCGEKAYQATGMRVPHKKPPKGKLSPKQKKENRELAQARVCVEHGIGKLKIWQILTQRYRNARRKHSLTLKNVAGLCKLMYA